MIPNRYSPKVQGEEIPKWKQDLVQRRKSTSRTIISAGGMVKLRVTCPTNMVKLTAGNQNSKNTQRINRPHSIHIDTPTKCSGEQLKYHKILNSSETNNDSKSIILDEKIKEKFLVDTVEEESTKKSKVNIKLKINDEDYNSDSSDEVAHSPGINAIKDKYLTKCSSPPSVTNLEKRAISLEDICQQIDSTRLKPKYDFIKRPCQFKVSQYQAKYLEMINQSSNLKSKPTIKNTERLIQNSDAPPVNLVKQRAKMFEQNPELKVPKPTWSKSNTLTIAFKDTKDSFQGTLYETSTNDSERMNVLPSTSELKPNVPLNKPPSTSNERLISTKFLPSNHVFQELNSLEMSQNAGKTSVVCM